MRDGETLDRARACQHVDGAPVGDHGYRQIRDRRQRRFVIERACEEMAGFGQERRPPLRLFFAGDIPCDFRCAEHVAVAADRRDRHRNGYFGAFSGFGGFKYVGRSPSINVCGYVGDRALRGRQW